MWACGDKVLEQRARELRGDPRGPANCRHPCWAAGRKPTLTPAQRISRGRNSDHRRLGWAAQTKGREENSRSHAKNTVGIYKQFGWAGKRCMAGGRKGGCGDGGTPHCFPRSSSQPEDEDAPSSQWGGDEALSCRADRRLCPKTPKPALHPTAFLPPHGAT